MADGREIAGRALDIIRAERAERERLAAETMPGNPFPVGSTHWRIYNSCAFAKELGRLRDGKAKP